MTSLVGSGFMTEEDHLNIKIVTALLFIMPAHYMDTHIYGNMYHETNKLKIHANGIATVKKQSLSY